MFVDRSLKPKVNKAIAFIYAKIIKNNERNHQTNANRSSIAMLQ